MQHGASEYVPIAAVQLCKRQMPQKLKGCIFRKLRPVLRESHAPSSHLERIVHENEQNSAKKNHQPFPFYQRIEPRLNEPAEAYQSERENLGFQSGDESEHLVLPFIIS